MEFRTCLASAWRPSHPQSDVQGEFLCVHGRGWVHYSPRAAAQPPWGDRTHRGLGQQLLGSLKHFLLCEGPTLTLLESSAGFLVFLKKKNNYRKDFIFLNVLCEKCLFLSSY